MIVNFATKHEILTDLAKVTRNGKIVRKHGAYCSYFRLSLKFLGWLYKEYIKTAKNGCFHCIGENFLSEKDFVAVLAISIITIMVPTLLFDLQIKKIITNAPFVL